MQASSIDLAAEVPAGVVEVEPPPAVFPFHRHFPPAERNLRVRVERSDVRPSRSRILRRVSDGAVVRVRSVARPRVARHVRLIVGDALSAALRRDADGDRSAGVVAALRDDFAAGSVAAAVGVADSVVVADAGNVFIISYFYR